MKKWIVAACLLVPGLMRAQDFGEFKQFNAEITITTDSMTTLQKMFSDNGKMRLEMNAGGRNQMMIVRPDQNSMYMIMPEQKMYLVMPYRPQADKDPTAVLRDDKAKREYLGKETIKGQDCEKYRVTTEKSSTLFWVTSDGKKPVRAVNEDSKVTMDWDKFERGPQDASLFEPPADYQKMAMPAMPGMGGMPGGASPVPSGD